MCIRSQKESRSTEAGIRTGDGGFTILELMIVITIVAILASIAVPMYRSVILQTREAVLRDHLYTLRSLVDQYTIDKKKAPQTLDELVEAGYLRELPEDPMTGSRSSWVVEFGDPIAVDQLEGGIVDVHSASPDISSEGVPYSQW